MYFVWGIVCRGKASDRGFEAKNGKEVSCEAMILSFPIWGNEMIYTLLFIMLFVYFADL